MIVLVVVATVVVTVNEEDCSILKFVPRKGFDRPMVPIKNARGTSKQECRVVVWLCVYVRVCVCLQCRQRMRLWIRS